MPASTEMSNANTVNPMKKRFRSWKSVPEEQPRRRRRYPRLVVRDHTGNFIANHIATAPKVELPPNQAIPPSVTVPSDPNIDEENKTTSARPDTPPRDAAWREDSLDLSASTRDRGEQNGDGRPSLQSPTSPLLEKSTAVDKAETMLRMLRNPARDLSARKGQPSPHMTVPPQLSPPAYNPVPAARVNPVPVPPEPYCSPPEYAVRPSDNSDEYSPYKISSSTQTPPFTPVMTFAGERLSTPTSQADGHNASQRLGPDPTQGAVHVKNTPQEVGMYQPEVRGYGIPQRASVPSETHERAQQEEKVILAGTRCGTVEYWRSSLQMPRQKGVLKAVKTQARRVHMRMKQGTPDHTFVAQPVQATQQHSTSGPSRVYPAYPLQHAVHSTDHDINSPRRPDTEIKHEFWRTATKLPRASAETTRVKRLAHGRRRIDCSNMAYVDSVNDRSVARPTNEVAVTGAPISGRKYAGTQQTAQANLRWQPEFAPQGQAPIERAPHSGSVKNVEQRPLVTSQPVVQRGEVVPLASKGKGDSEMRRLLFLRDFELRRLRTHAQSRFHVKMNLRGRVKLEQWVCSDIVTKTASDLIVTMFNLDRRVLSKTDEIRRNALYEMTNEDLRILDALMFRVTSRGGRTNWTLLTTSLSPERFIKTLPSPE